MSFRVLQGFISVLLLEFLVTARVNRDFLVRNAWTICGEYVVLVWIFAGMKRRTLEKAGTREEVCTSGGSEA